MHQINMTLELCRNGVGQSTNCLPASLCMAEMAEVGVKHIVGLPDGHGNLDPVTGMRYIGRGQVVRR